MNKILRNGLIGTGIALTVGIVAWRGLQSPEQEREPVEALAVQVISPHGEDWQQVIEASGPITPWQEVIVSSETGGLQVVRLLVDVGAQVKRGQVLAMLSTQSLEMDLREQQAAVSQAEVTLQQASSELRRAKAVEDIGLSRQQVEGYAFAEKRARAALESAKAQLSTMRLRLSQAQIVAPDDGYVSSKSAVLGDVVQAGAELFRLVRQGRIEWRPEVDASQLAALAAGQEARVTLPMGTSESGHVREVGPTLSRETGRAVIYVSLPSESVARPGVFAKGTILVGNKPATTVPESAVVPRDGRSYVYLVDDQQTTSSQVVMTGRRQDGRVEILSGIDQSDRVVARGGAFLSEGVKVRIIDAPPAQPDATP